MKLLKVKVSHYKRMEEGLEISFVPSARKTDEDKTYELNEIDDGLFIFATSAIIGKNASGKTSVLNLLKNVYKMMSTFQIQDEVLSISGTQIEMTFHHAGKIFYYKTKLIRNMNLGTNLSFEGEELRYMKYSKSKTNKIFDLNNFKNYKVVRNLPDDISLLYYVFNERNHYAYYFDDLISQEDVYHRIYNLYQHEVVDKKYWKHVLRLFDENIENLEEVKNDVFALTYKNKIYELSAKELFSFLSSGTTKGISLYTYAIQALLDGKEFIIDEIENHFHKTLVENLVMLFKDKSVNKNGATLIFSTHYCELLDIFNRNDNIWIVKCEKDIVLTNMYKHYDVRNDLLKSKKFYDDHFGTAVSYDLLMNLKNELINA